VTRPAHNHHFIPGTDSAKPPLVLLHGSGGDEHDLVSLAEEVAPGSPILARTPILANFIETVLAGHIFARRPIAIGFSNGAIMAAALLLTRPSLLAGAILFRPLSPFTNDLPTRLDGTPVLVIDGDKDGRRSPGDGLRLAERLIRAGATVTHHLLQTGHSTTAMDREIAKAWLHEIVA